MGMNLNDLIESKFIKQEDVDGEMVVTIRKVTKTNVARDDEDPKYKASILFDEFKKPMVGNPTNLKRIAKAFGNDVDDWIDKKVVLYVDHDVEFGGKIVGGLRIRAMTRPSQRSTAKSLEDANAELNRAADDDTIPF